VNPNLSTSYRASQLDHERRVTRAHRAALASEATPAGPARSPLAGSRLWFGSMLMSVGSRVLGLPGGILIQHVTPSRT
jgi:hypothetical protein